MNQAHGQPPQDVVETWSSGRAQNPAAERLASLAMPPGAAATPPPEGASSAGVGHTHEFGASTITENENATVWDGTVTEVLAAPAAPAAQAHARHDPTSHVSSRASSPATVGEYDDEYDDEDDGEGAYQDDQGSSGTSSEETGASMSSSPLPPHVQAQLPLEARRHPYQLHCLAVIDDVVAMWESHPFRRNIYEIVTDFELSGYLDAVETPHDLATLKTEVDDKEVTPSSDAFVLRLRLILANCGKYWCQYRQMEKEDVVRCAKIVEADLLRRILKAHLDHFTWEMIDFTADGSAIPSAVTWERPAETLRAPPQAASPGSDRAAGNQGGLSEREGTPEIARLAPSHITVTEVCRACEHKAHSAHTCGKGRFMTPTNGFGEPWQRLPIGTRRAGARGTLSHRSGYLESSYPPSSGASESGISTGGTQQTGTKWYSDVARRKRAADRSGRVFPSSSIGFPNKITFAIHRLVESRASAGSSERLWSFVMSGHGRRLEWHGESTLAAQVGRERFDALVAQFNASKSDPARGNAPSTPEPAAAAAAAATSSSLLCRRRSSGGMRWLSRRLRARRVSRPASRAAAERAGSSTASRSARTESWRSSRAGAPFANIRHTSPNSCGGIAALV
eukprot:m.316876 g.316876  ORF g.316876 m.316876 type:complete len:623 (-) comp27550_c4_seq1:675-2543(-)